MSTRMVPRPRSSGMWRALTLRATRQSACEADEALAARAERRDRRARVGDQRLEPIARRAGVFGVLLVGDVVGVLERDAVRRPEAREARARIGRRAAGAPADLQRRAEQRRGLLGVQRLQRRQRRRAAARPGRGPARAPCRTRPPPAPARATPARKSPRPRGALARLRDPVERQRQQRVAREDRGRFAERLVVARAARGGSRRRPSPAGRRESASSSAPARRRRRRAARRRRAGADGLGRRQRQQRADALARRQQRVAHRLEQAAGIAVGGRRQSRLEQAVELRAAGGDPCRSAIRTRALTAVRSSFFDFERRGAARRPAASRPSSRRRRGSRVPRRHSSMPSSNARRLSSSGRFPPSSRSTMPRSRARMSSKRSGAASVLLSLAMVCRLFHGHASADLG